MRFLAVALATLLLVTGCGDGGSSVAPTGPAPRLPLSWTDVPESVTVKRGETTTFTATLSAAVDATVEITTHESGVELSGELIRAGVFRGTVTGVASGEFRISLIATYTGYHRADATVNILVEGVFDEQIWRQLVFGDLHGCPPDVQPCNLFQGKSVEERMVQVLPFTPHFHLVDNPSDDSRPEGIDRFSESEMAVVETAIRDAVEQLTRNHFDGWITSSAHPRRQHEWVDVLPVTDEWFQGGFGGSRPCGAARVGATTGRVVLNVECVRADETPLRGLAMHEVGHALGFFHVRGTKSDHLMAGGRIAPGDVLDDFSEDERFHAFLAHELGRDAPYTSDPRSPSSRGSQLSGYPERTDITVICPAH